MRDGPPLPSTCASSTWRSLGKDLVLQVTCNRRISGHWWLFTGTMNREIFLNILPVGAIIWNTAIELLSLFAERNGARGKPPFMDGTHRDRAGGFDLAPGPAEISQLSDRNCGHLLRVPQGCLWEGGTAGPLDPTRWGGCGAGQLGWRPTASLRPLSRSWAASAPLCASPAPSGRGRTWCPVRARAGRVAPAMSLPLRPRRPLLKAAGSGCRAARALSACFHRRWPRRAHGPCWGTGPSPSSCSHRCCCCRCRSLCPRG